MGMLLRRRTKKALAEPKVNGKPVEKEPKNRKLNKEPDYVKKTENVVPTYKV